MQTSLFIKVTFYSIKDKMKHLATNPDHKKINIANVCNVFVLHKQFP